MKLELCRAPSCAGVSFTVAMASPCQSCVDISETVAMAVPWQSCAGVSETVTMTCHAKAVRTYRR